MIFLFLTYCISICLLFFLPPSLLKPFKQGLFLFTFLLFIFNFALSKVRYFKNLNKIWERILIRNFFSGNTFLIWFGVLIVHAGFLYHSFQLTSVFSSNFQFHDADYVGMQEVIRNISRGNGYLSTFYSLSGEGSYLQHHFSPSLLFFVPFELFVPGRWGYAVGVYFYFCLGSVLWIRLLLKSQDATKETIPILFLTLIALLSNIYLYRLGTSYHFEVLVYPFSAIFFHSFQTHKINFRFFMSFFLFVMIKEDIALYLLFFLSPELARVCFSSFKKRKKTNNGHDLFSRIKMNPVFTVGLFCIIYLVMVFVLRPFLTSESTEHWFGALSKDYSSDFKQVTGVEKSARIFLELMVSMGLGFTSQISSFFGVLLIYLTHAFSTRPWHHEVYSYYCYSIIPFLLYASTLWIKEIKQLSPWVFFLLLSLVFFRNSQDSNFPIDISKLNPGVQQENMNSEVRSELSEIKKKDLISGESILFSQYNLSFFMPSNTLLYPLNQSHLKNKLCKRNICYLVIAPKFTEEKLVSSEFIASKREDFLTGSKIFQGKWIEIWKSN